MLSPKSVVEWHYETPSNIGHLQHLHNTYQPDNQQNNKKAYSEHLDMPLEYICTRRGEEEKITN